MSNRLDSSTNNQLITELKQLRQDLDEFKTRQPTSNASGNLGYQSSSNATWDFTGNVTSSTTNNWDVYFTGDGSQAHPVVNPYCDFYINTISDPNRLPLFPRTWTDGTSVITGVVFLQVASVPNNTNQYLWHWLIGLSTNLAANVTVYMKLYAVGSCKGTVSIVRQP